MTKRNAQLLIETNEKTKGVKSGGTPMSVKTDSSESDIYKRVYRKTLDSPIRFFLSLFGIEW